MIKKITFLFLSILFCIKVNAQHNKPSDTTIYYRDQMGNPTDKAHVNDVIFIYPADNSSGKKLYPIKEIYLDGAIKLIGTSSTSSSIPLLEGSSMLYYPNGHKKAIATYTSGMMTGKLIEYYPNGLLYAVKQFDQHGKSLLIACRDSTGKIYAENGKGKWLKFDDTFANLVESGPISDSVENGTWRNVIDNDSTKYVTIYKKGKVISSTNPDEVISADSLEKKPVFSSDSLKFMYYLGRNVRYPAYDRENNVQGKVVVSFVIEKDGTVSNVQAIKAPDIFMANEVSRVIELSPKWSPGIQNGHPVRCKYIIPISFSLAEANQ